MHWATYRFTRVQETFDGVPASRARDAGALDRRHNRRPAGHGRGGTREPIRWRSDDRRRDREQVAQASRPTYDRHSTPARQPLGCRPRSSVPDPQIMVNLLGARDEILRLVERPLASDVHVRGNEITITGAPADNALAERLFAELLELIEKGETLTADAVRRTVGMLEQGTAERPAEVLTLNILSRRGRTIRPKTLGPEALRRRDRRAHDRVRHRPGRHRQDLPGHGQGGPGAAGQAGQPDHPDPAGGRGGRAARASCPARSTRRSTRTCGRSTTRCTTCSTPSRSRG